jgi:hypothetical protein
VLNLYVMKQLFQLTDLPRKHTDVVKLPQGASFAVIIEGFGGNGVGREGSMATTGNCESSKSASSSDT